MASWKISGIDTAQAGFSNLQIHFRSRNADEATFVHDGAAYDGSSAFLYGSTYTITRDGVLVFSGRCITIPRQATGRAEAITYTLKGGWYWLENVMYQQRWRVGEDNAFVTKTRVLLGYDDDGAEIGCNKQIRNIIQCAIDGQAPIAIGIINVSEKVLPHDEQVDLTCAEAIDRILAWFPDTAVWFDYSTATPTINMSRRASLSAVTLPTAGVAEEITITPRYDAQVPGVKIIYEIVSGTNADGETKVHDVVVDSAGNPDAFGGLIYTVSLAASSASRLWQSIKSDGGIPLNLTDYPGYSGHSEWGEVKDRQRPSAQDWWLSKLPHLEGWENVKLHDQTPPPENWPPVVGFHKLDYELIKGEVQAWMASKHAVSITAKVRADYTLNGKEVKNELLSFTLTLTNAGTGIYSALGSYTEGDKIPEGLAAEVFAAIGQLHYDGKISTIAEEPPATCGIRNVLNLSGGHPDWDTMRACVQAVDWDVDFGTSTITFGPPEHIGVADLVQMARANTKRASVGSLPAKKSSDIEEDEMTIGGDGSKSNSTAGGEYVMRQDFGDPEVDSKVTIDGANGSVTATNDSTTLKLDPNEEPEVFNILTSLQGFAFKDHSLQLQFSTATLKKISNAIVSIEAGEDVIETISFNDIGVMVRIGADGTVISASKMKVWVPEMEELDPEDMIFGEECP